MDRKPAVRPLLPLLLVAACAQDFADLTPFPCPADQSCPDGLSCIPGEGCAPARDDAPCPAEGDCDLTSGDAELSCRPALSLCEHFCMGGIHPTSTATATCPPDRICVDSLRSCLLACTDDSDCPNPLQCKTFDQEGSQRVCMPATVNLPACQSAAVGDSCLYCGADGFIVPCGDGNYCAENSTCADNNSCDCVAGYHAENCAGELCSADNFCPYPDWHCVPDLWSIDCGGSSDAFAIDCTCVDQSTATVPCGGGSCENACLNGF